MTRPPIQTERDHPLYYPHRQYKERWWATPGYRLPLPVGRYELTLRFCETSPAPVPRLYGIEVEGDQVCEPFDPLAEHGFAVPRERRFQVEVTDGALDVVFTAIRGKASVNAIEVRRLD